MKLATYKDGSRDGQLVVVSRDLSTAHYATGIAQRMQQVFRRLEFFGPSIGRPVSNFEQQQDAPCLSF